MIKALFVDDERYMLELAKEYLEVPGEVSIDTTESVKHALEKILTTKYDAIVSDYQMPLQDGIDLLIKVRSMGISIPFILFTGRGREEIAIEAIKNGATFYLNKGGEANSQFAELKNMLFQSVEKERGLRQLIESEIRYRRLFETAQDAILIIDARTDSIIDANPFIEKLLGYQRSELVGKKLWEIGPFRDIQETKSAFTKLKEKRFIRYDNLPLQSKNGKALEVEFVSNLYNVGSEDIIQCNIRDNSEKVRAEDALANSNKKLNTLFRITNHDISNQITIIDGNAQLLLREGLREGFKEKMEQILMATNNIQQQVYFAREYQSLGENRPTWQRLEKILLEATQKFDVKDVGVELNVEQMEIFGDNLLPKAFYNLIDNSLEHGQNVRRISVTIMPVKNDVKIIYQDDGVGLSEEIKVGIFEHEGKSGHGLALVKDILSITGMTIVENGIKGKGARFEITVLNGYYRM
jgi:PAS domain S-box-containing protein